MSSSLLFLKLLLEGNKPVTGEATMKGYEGQIDVDSISWKIGTKLLPAEENSKARVEARPKHLSISKVFDEASGNLCKAADERTPFTTATISMVSQEFEQMGAGDAIKKLLVMEVILTDGHIEDLNIQASEGNKAVGLKERVTLSFAHSEVRYYPRVYQGAGRSGAKIFKLEHPSSKS